SWWVNLHGHAHPYIAKKIADQAFKLEHVMLAGFTHPNVEELATRLLPKLPGKMEKIFYSDNGSTAVEIALKMALQYFYNQGIKKTKILSFKGGYHGDTFGAMSVSSRNSFNKPFWNHLFEVISITPPLQGNEAKSIAELEAALRDPSVACFIFEPLILGVGGMKIYEAKYLDQLLSLCKKLQVLTIADEVMTGFGRTGSLFACDHLLEKPDIICLSKGITGGFLPLGATACSMNIYEAFLSDEKQKAFLHGHSYSGNPIACSAALASLDLLQDANCFMQRLMIEKAHQVFCKNKKNHPKLLRCESLGTILAVEYKTENPNYFSKLGRELYSFFLSKKILLRPLGNVLYVMPPYCVSKNDLENIYTAITQALED
ncbi:MAG: adenosylmethionine--8-amino-7-oxononanoate transaminase, partial [Simkaniaceae bacterium]|nr:adenosylmethionine--8-amino-7-oxononanoate transaminase [Simkaniaceae bacterium]